VPSEVLKEFVISEYITSCSFEPVTYYYVEGMTWRDWINSKYNTKGYVISMHPVKVSQANSSTVVVNENKYACSTKYRSNRKYYHFNQAVKTIMKDYLEIKYIETFTDIMTINDPNKNYSYKITYNTDDGVHWDETTTKMYVKLMLDKISEL
jgi:hypothetical protein